MQHYGAFFAEDEPITGDMSMNKKSVLIVGNGMATGRLLDELIKRDVSQCDITVIGDEIHGSYNRIMLSPVLAGETTIADIVNKPVEWYQDAGIQFVGGARVNRIERSNKTVTTETGQVYSYDELIIATGSRPARIPAKNQNLQHIYSFRTLDDVDRILASAHSAAGEGQAVIDGARAVVVGGGLLGLEAAYGLALKGLNVTLVHRSGWLLNRQLDKQAAELLRCVMQSKNVHFQLGCEVDRFIGEESVAGVLLSNGDRISCQLAVIATGISPNKELGLDAGLQGTRGIEVDEYMRTSDPFISAVGECVEFEGTTFGLVEPIWQQCIALADRLTLQRFTPFADLPVATKLKVSGVQLFSAGDFITTPEHRELLYSDIAAGIYRKILLKNNCIVGVVLFGDTRDGQDYFRMMQEQVSVEHIAPMLLMGKAFYQTQTAAA